METVTMSSKGQIVIPKQIRDSLHLREGTKFEVQVRGNSIVFVKSPDWRTVYDSILPSNDSLTDALLAERAVEREREGRK